MSNTQWNSLQRILGAETRSAVVAAPVVQPSRESPSAETYREERVGTAALVAALCQIFPPERHQIVWEPSADESSLIGLGRRTVRFDDPHASDGIPPAVPLPRPAVVVRAGTGLAEAFARVTLRDAQCEAYWVVVVVSAESFVGQLTPQRLEQLDGRPQRLLVVLRGRPEATDPPPTDAAGDGFRAASSDRLGDRIARLCGAVPHWLDGHHPATVLRGLARLRQRGNSAVVYVDSTPAAPSAAAPHSPSAADDVHPVAAPRPAHPEAHWQSSLEEAVRAVQRDDDRVCRLGLGADEEPGTAGEPAVLAQGGLAQGQDAAIVRAGDLAQGGCHPVLTLSAEVFRQRHDQIARILCAPALPVTLVVCDVAEGQTSTVLARLSGLPNTGVMMPRDAAELEPMLRLSVRSDRPAAILLPASDTFDGNSRDRPARPRGRSSKPINGKRAGANGSHGRHLSDIRPDAAEPGRDGGFPFTPEAARREHHLVLGTPLSPTIEQWAREYERVGFEHRTRYLWQWCLHGLELTTLSCATPELREHLVDTKLLAVMFGVMLDDIADRQNDPGFLRDLLAIVAQDGKADWRGYSAWQREYAEFTHALWDAFSARIRCYPCAEVYQELLRYDTDQVLNTMRYSQLVNANPAVSNLAEHDLYSPHNMQMMCFATTDLMCSPDFNGGELGRLREAVWNAQCMGRIGNLVSTWRRELAERDFSSGVLVRAITRGGLALDELAGGDVERIEALVRDGGHERHFFRKWQQHHRRLVNLSTELESVDLMILLHGLERLLCMELGSRGFK